MDCFRSASGQNTDETQFVVPADFNQTSQARQFLVEALRVGANETAARRGKDLTLKYVVDTHFDFRKDVIVPGTNFTYSCDFDKYIALDHYAVATLEVPGSHWYLQDETEDYPFQDQVDPMINRYGLYLNAMECAMDWIDTSARKASASGKKALFFTFQGVFYGNYGIEALTEPSTGFFSAANFRQYMQDVAGRSDLKSAYQPLFDKLTRVALQYPNLQFYVIHADGHRFQTVRLNPNLSNQAGRTPLSNHNLRAHMVEGTSRALTMWTRFTVDPNSFQPVTLKEEWSREAFNREPVGHAWIPYSPPKPQ